MMKTTPILLLSAGLLAATSSAQALVLVNESWSGYTDNANLNGVAVQAGTGLSGNWSVANASAGVLAQNGSGETMSSTYGSTTVTGNFANPGNAYQDPVATASLSTAITNKDIYFRYLATIVAAPTASGGSNVGIWLNFGTDMVGFHIADGTTGAASLFVGTTPGGGATSSITGGLLNNNNVLTGGGTTSYTDNSPSHIILGKLTWDGSAYSAASLYLNPTSDQFSTFSSLDKLENATLTAGLASISSLSIGFEDPRAGAASSAPRVGQVTFAESWSDLGVVVPEPSTYALLGGLAAFGLVMLRRRR